MSLILTSNPVENAIANLIRSNKGKIYKVPNDNVVLLKTKTTDTSKNNSFAILSGGGSGHEPSFAGFLDENLLDCAICGEIFTSPSVGSVYNGLKYLIEKEKKQEILVIVMNYTGDRLHFGAAIEKAKIAYPDIKIEMFIVADDKSLPENIKPRGLTGTLTYIRLAKAMRMDGNYDYNFDQIISRLNEIQDQNLIGTVGCSVSNCSSKTEMKSVFANQFSLGLGIHGEPGFKQVVFEKADYNRKIDLMLKNVFDALNERLIPSKNSNNNNLLVTISNLGGFSKIEFANIVEAACQKLQKSKTDEQNLNILVGAGDLMTSLDMIGFNISFAYLTENEMTYFEKRIDNKNWPTFFVLVDNNLNSEDEKIDQNVNEPILKMQLTKNQSEILKKVCQKLYDIENRVNELDGKSGDGDCGNSFKRLADFLLARFEIVENEKIEINVVQFLSSLAHSVRKFRIGIIFLA